MKNKKFSDSGSALTRVAALFAFLVFPLLLTAQTIVNPTVENSN